MHDSITPARTFRIFAPDQTPHQALTWKSPAHRKRVLRTWRHAVFTAFGDSTRAVRLAWVLADWFNAKTGYCYATDDTLGKETGLPRIKVADTMKVLDDGGAIIRVHRVINGRTQRHIYPSAALIFPTAGNMDIPQQPGTQIMRLPRRPRTPRSQLHLAFLQSRQEKP